MTANKLEPLGPGVLLRFGAREVIPGLGAGGSGFLDCALAAHRDQRPGVGEIGFQGLDGKGVNGPDFYATVSGSGFEKKGVALRPSSACAFLKSFS